MQKIQIETTQNVSVEYEIAGVGKRIIAKLIDGLIVSGYMFSMFMIISLTNSLGLSGYAVVTIIFLPVLLYDLLCESLMGGQSFGKKAMDIKVVKLDGSQATIVSYFLRWIIGIIDNMISYGTVAVITILINGKGQRLGDIAANTTVIRIKNDASLDDTILTETTEDYKIVFPEVVSLSDKDAAIIKEVLDRFNEMSFEDQLSDKLLLKTKEAIAKKLGINTDMNPFPFLNTILKDYNHINIEPGP